METFQIRTDLALEARESVNEEESKLRGVSVEEHYEEETDAPFDWVRNTPEHPIRHASVWILSGISVWMRIGVLGRRQRITWRIIFPMK